MIRKAFTLIELLIVIAVIGIISSIVIANISTARMKARDQKRISDFRTFKIALDMYYDTNGKYPTSPNLATSWADENYNFETVAGILVSSGFLGAVPKDPKDTQGYAMYDYGKNTAAGMILVTQLETLQATTTAIGNSCRPFTANWCSSTLTSSYYCLCNIY